MLRRILLALTLLVAMGGVCVHQAQALTPAQRIILLSQSSPSLDLNFLAMGGTLDSRISFSRASTATGALYTDAAGASFTTYSANQPRLSSNGLLIEEQRTNYLLNSSSPATQTTASLSTGTYALFGNGTGSLTSAAGTAVGTGFGTLSTLSGNFKTITITTAGTVTITVSGTVDWFDLQAGSFPTSHIVTAGTTATRAADVATVATSAFTFNQNAGTAAAEVLPNYASGSTDESLFDINAGSEFNRFYCDIFPTNLRAIATSSGTNYIASSAGTVTIGSINKGAMSYGTGQVTGSLNGGAVFSASATLPSTSLTAVYLGGASVGGASLNGWHRRFRYWPRRLSNSQLQSLTQ